MRRFFSVSLKRRFHVLEFVQVHRLGKMSPYVYYVDTFSLLAKERFLLALRSDTQRGKNLLCLPYKGKDGKYVRRSANDCLDKSKRCKVFLIQSSGKKRSFLN